VWSICRAGSDESIWNVTLDGPRAGGGLHDECSRAVGVPEAIDAPAIDRRRDRTRGRSSMSSVGSRTKLKSGVTRHVSLRGGLAAHL